MKKKLEGIIAAIFVILLAIFLILALTARGVSVRDPIEQQIHDESMIQ